MGYELSYFLQKLDNGVAQINRAKKLLSGANDLTSLLSLFLGIENGHYGVVMECIKEYHAFQEWYYGRLIEAMKEHDGQILYEISSPNCYPSDIKLSLKALGKKVELLTVNPFKVQYIVRFNGDYSRTWLNKMVEVEQTSIKSHSEKIDKYQGIIESPKSWRNKIHKFFNTSLYRKACSLIYKKIDRHKSAITENSEKIKILEEEIVLLEQNVSSINAKIQSWGNYLDRLGYTKVDTEASYSVLWLYNT
ncbi:MAG: hypothetical protein A4E53_01511 [Pelotomaculum sp. PtaB.Bin104]|nr:MAG: hypothetical protein A4E53_01511 [Pelotomaculum sp. PtaB.Bin104]